MKAISDLGLVPSRFNVLTTNCFPFMFDLLGVVTCVGFHAHENAAHLDRGLVRVDPLTSILGLSVELVAFVMRFTRCAAGCLPSRTANWSN